MNISKYLLAACLLSAFSVRAENMPEPVEGTVTLSVASGTTTYTSAIPAGTERIVKTGDGEAVLAAATDGFDGSVEVQGGTLSLTDYAALGTGGKAPVSVSDGATFALKGRHATSDSECLYAAQITIAGSGAGSVGALYYAPTSGEAKNADAAFKSLRLSGDASVGNTKRCGWWAGKVDLNGKTLSLLGGGQFMFRNTEFTPGTVVFQSSSTSYFWGNNDFTKNGCTEENLTFTVQASATVNMYNSTSEIPAFWSLTGALTGSAGSGVQYNRVTGTVKLMANTTLSSDGGSLNINGKVDMNGKELSRYQARPTYFAGPVDGRAAGSSIKPKRGDFVFTGNVERVISGATTVDFQNIYLGGAQVVVDGGTYLSSQLQCGCSSGRRGTFWLKSGYAGFGLACIGANGNDSLRPNGVFRMSGGVFNTEGSFTMCSSGIASERWSQAFYFQDGGLFALTNVNLEVTDPPKMDVGLWGDAVMRVTGGTNSTVVSSGATRKMRFRASGGKSSSCVSVEGAGSRIETESAQFIQYDSNSRCTLSLKDGGEFCAKRLVRSASYAADSSTAVFNLIADGGVFKPLLANSINDRTYADYPDDCKKASPNHTVLLGKGLVFDLSECVSFTTGLGDSEISWRLLKPTGKSLKSVTLPAAVESLDYFEPAMIVVEGDGFGACAYCDVDRSTMRLTDPVVLCAGSGYDEATTKVYVYAPDSVTRHECTFALEAASCGPLTVRGSDRQLYMPMPDNTWDGGIVVEQGTLRLGSRGFVENTAVSLGDSHGHRGKLLIEDAAAHTISTLAGCGELALAGEGSFTVTDSYSVEAARLTAAGGVVTTRTLTFAEGSKIVVSGIDGATVSKVDLVSAGTLVGEPTVEITGTDAAQWTVVRRGDKFVLKRQKGLMLLLR